MDLQPFHAYLDRIMLRRFLTLLAMLTGFAVIGAPVQAQPTQEAAAACEAFELVALPDASDLHAQQAAPVRICSAVAIVPVTDAVESPRLAPPVQLRIDRSHE